MEEKKQNDTEIDVGMIEKTLERDKTVDVWLLNGSVWEKYNLQKILNIIHRLQAENNDMHKDLIQAEKYAETLSIENAEQKAEIERLTEERDLYKNQFNELEPRFFDLRYEKAELQKQIDELIERIINANESELLELQKELKAVKEAGILFGAG